jgi:hypothetical protein
MESEEFCEHFQSVLFGIKFFGQGFVGLWFWVLWKCKLSTRLVVSGVMLVLKQFSDGAGC